jgi:hypothetical protein
MTDQPRTPLIDVNPPASIEAEKALLGSVLINPDAFLTISAFLKPDDASWKPSAGARIWPS